MRRVVVTGLGLVTPLGTGVDPVWKRLLAGQSGINTIETFDTSDLNVRVGGQIPRGDGTNATFNPDPYFAPKEQRKVDDYITFGVVAASQALEDANWAPTAYEDQIATGVLVGSGVGGLYGIEQAALLLAERGPRRISPFFIPGRLINLVSGQISIKHGLMGPNHSVVTACSTGTHAIGDAARMIALSDADVMVAGGCESPVVRLAMVGFAACKSLSTGFNDAPEKASRPFDMRRDGFVMSEGAGVVVLEELEHARARGVHIYGEIVGYGMSGDAYHITSPVPDGNGALRAMRAAFKRAGLAPDAVDYVNAHGTSTPVGDEIELRAVEQLFGEAAGALAMSSTKSAVGHTLGAAGAIEAIFSLLSIRDNIAPPTLNLDDPCLETAIDLVPHKAQERRIDAVLSNSFGFGGTNASLIFARLAD
ncbi:MAG: beta-ketoacyl-ACP synthase II [Alphaproteobacteria bacterium]